MTVSSTRIIVSTSAIFKTIVEDIVDLIRYRELLRNLVSRDLKVRYKRSVLGLVWTMLNPLLMMVVFTIVFSSLFRFAVEHFAIYFLSAYLPWHFFAQTTMISMSILLANSSLVKRIYVPRSIFVIATVLSGLLNLLVALIPLLLIMLVTGMPIQPAILFIPIPILLATLFTLGLSLILSAFAIFFSDVIQIYQVLLTVWMYLTPVIYPLEIVPVEYHLLIMLNPMYYIVEAFRAPIYRGALPDPYSLLVGFLSGLAALVVGWWVFSKSAERFVYYL